MKPLTVVELIDYLWKLPPNMPIAYRLHSEQILLQLEDIEITPLCLPRNDGWVQNERPDMPTQNYLLFPGN
jgi:hypothetical protein